MSANDVDFAKSDHGVALAALSLTAADVTAGQLVRLNDTPVSTGRGMWLVSPETDFPDPKLIAFGNWFRSEVTKITQ